MKGPEWLAARQWEVERRKELLASSATQVTTLTGLELLLAWGEQYLDYVKRTMSRSTYVEKTTVMKAFFAYCREEGIDCVERLTKPILYQFLVDVSDAHTAHRANVYRKNLLAAWNWGIDSVEGFPQGRSVLERIKPFPVDAGERYVPPEEDIVKVLREARGQDLVMLLTYYYTGARRSEVFRLSWEKDIRLDTGQIRLIDHKGRNGQQRVRWLSMHPELIKALTWWRKARPCKVDNVFMQTQNESSMGLPFKQRLHLMNRLCAKAGVKPFGFHALRHKAAAITFTSGGLNAAQILMGHSRATTTDIYVRSAGLYSNQDSILSALGESEIGQAAEELLEQMEMEMPPEVVIREAFCNQGQVTKLVQ
ncbi:MAG: site-specific integrase [Desulfovibrionaceae bacterium]|nr:site-specific integrase [Desulfovibrionaceae bacterium]